MNNTFDPGLSLTMNTLFKRSRTPTPAARKTTKAMNGHQAVMSRDGNILSVRFGAART